MFIPLSLCPNNSCFVQGLVIAKSIKYPLHNSRIACYNSRIDKVLCRYNSEIVPILTLRWTYIRGYYGRHYTALPKSVNHRWIIDFNACWYITPRCHIILYDKHKQIIRLKSGIYRSQVEHSNTEPTGKEGMIRWVWFFSYRWLVNTQTSMHMWTDI